MPACVSIYPTGLLALENLLRFAAMTNVEV